MKPQCIWQAYLIPGERGKWCNIKEKNCEGFDDCTKYEAIENENLGTTATILLQENGCCL